MTLKQKKDGVIHGFGVRGPNCSHFQGLSSMSPKAERFWPGVQSRRQVAQPSFLVKQAVPTSRQHPDLRQSLFAAAHLSATHEETLRPGVTFGLPGVRGPSSLQVHGEASSPKRSGPGAQLARQKASLWFFSKHCMPASLQQPDERQSSPSFAHVVATQSASFAPAGAGASFGGGAAGVLEPTVSQPHFWPLNGVSASQALLH
mmetsp:Transcript_102312/g.294503  ORF Transcript_102312/g.294503 Transcript_102312/m.294503 type:complete len:203 (-) Transcript_102312:921-1529(-)